MRSIFFTIITVVAIVYVFLLLVVYDDMHWFQRFSKPVSTDKSGSIISPQDTSTTLRLLTYGLPDFERDGAVDVIAVKWGIQYYSVAGCLVTKELADSVERHNKTVKGLIADKHGKSWETVFEKEVDEELARQKAVAALLDNESMIINRRSALEKEGYYISYYYQPVSKNEYQISACGRGQLDGKETFVSYFRYKVDLKKKMVTLLSDTIIKE